MISFLKRVRHAIRWRIHAYLGIGGEDNSQFDAVLSHFTKDLEPVIFDIGAHNGESIRRFKKIFPKSTIHAFEPDIGNFKIMDKGWGDKKGIILNNIGVSRKKGTLTFHRNLKTNTSSFHAVNTESEWAKMRSARQEVTPEEFTEKSYDVPIIDLDSYVDEHNISYIHVLKMDTQGHEDEVLAGAEKTLKSGIVDVIETELIVGNAYTKSLQFYDLEKVLIPMGYRFYAIDSAGDRLSTPSLSFNIIYVHERLLNQ